jgi:glutathione S-transferase
MKNPLTSTPSSGLGPNESGAKYTVPAIHHVPTNTYLMDSFPIAQFLESTYPDPPLQLTSELGTAIEAQAGAVAGAAFRASIMPREILILPPRSQDYFRPRVEKMLGHPLEDLLDAHKEATAWAALEDRMRAVGELMRTNKAEGPFVLGARPSWTDFFVVGVLQCDRTVDEDVFQRFVAFPGYKEVYEACVPFMEKKD